MSTQTSTRDALALVQRRLIGAQVSLHGLVESMKIGTQVDRKSLAEKLRTGAAVMAQAAEWVENDGDFGGDAWTTPPYELRVQKPSEQPGNPATGGPTVIDDFLVGVEVKLEHLVGGAIDAFRIFRQTRAVRQALMKDVRRGLDSAQGESGLDSAQDQPANQV